MRLVALAMLAIRAIRYKLTAKFCNIAITILWLEGEFNIAAAGRRARDYPHRELKLAGLTNTQKLYRRP